MKLNSTVVLRTILIIVLAYLLASMLIPIETAYDGLTDETENYIIVKPETATDGTWSVTAQKGYSAGNRILLVGNIPDYWIFEDITSNYLNEYICFGQIVSSEEMYGEVVFTFEVSHSQIVYPVRRNNLLKSILGKKHVYLIDRFVI